MKLRGLLQGAVNRLRYVRRFSTCLRATDETVAEHCYYVATYSFFIAQSLQRKNPDLHINWKMLLSRGIFHDLEESLSGDMPRPFKHSSPELLHAIELATKHAVSEAISSVVDNSMNHEEIFLYWSLAKSNDLEGNILHFADYLSVLAYVAQEVRSGNTYFVEHAESMYRYSKVFEGDRFDFLRDMVIEANAFLVELLAP